jgi:phosphohistidine phosphatase
LKTLILIRHAKSSWKDSSLPDELRPLKKRGKRDAPEMGRRLAEREIEVDRLISSPAARALATAEFIAEEIGFPWDEILIDEDLYLASPYEILSIIHELDDHVDRVMLFGHNPEFTEFVNVIVPGLTDNMPTCGVVEFGFDIDTWTDIGEVDPVFNDFDYPKKIR